MTQLGNSRKQISAQADLTLESVFLNDNFSPLILHPLKRWLISFYFIMEVIILLLFLFLEKRALRFNVNF